jgi:hypothetical protein
MGTRPIWVMGIAVAIAGCGKVDHESIEQWRETRRGPQKLKRALADPDLTADLRAHAAQALVQIGEWDAVHATLTDMAVGQRGPLVSALAGRLAVAAQPADGPPSAVQAGAKDALFGLREFAAAADLDRIDTHLADWIGENYIDRSGRGRITGETLVRHLGRRAAPKVIAQARSLVATPADAKGQIPMLPDDLLLGLAFTGDPEAAGLLIDIQAKEHAEPTLQLRASQALFTAYVSDTATPRPDASALKPHVTRLAASVLDETLPGRAVNNGVAIIASAGPPECVAPLLDLIRRPRSEEAFLWLAVQQGLHCGGAAGIAKTVESISPDVSYQRGILDKYLWKKIVKLEPSDQVVASCRALLQSSSWVGRVTGIECLGMVGKRSDAEAVLALAADSHALQGWWGDQSGLPKNARKGPITLGGVAQQVARKLETM